MSGPARKAAADSVAKYGLTGVHFFRRVLPESWVRAWQQLFSFYGTGPLSAFSERTFSARGRLDGVPDFKGYRYPAPGTRAIQDKPTVAGHTYDNPYQIDYYTRDPRNLPPENEVRFVEDGSFEVPEGMGPKRAMLPAVERYDPSGLRSFWTTSNKSMYQSTQTMNREPHWNMPVWERRWRLNPKLRIEFEQKWKDRHEKYGFKLTAEPGQRLLRPSADEDIIW